MAQEFSRKFYQSKAWRNTRASYIESVGGICEKCISKGLYSLAEDVHHMILLTPMNISNPEVSLNHEHLIALCKSCHTQEHMGSPATRDDVMFDANGNLVKR